MFTGLVDGVGTVSAVTGTDAGIELRIECAYDDLAPGESIAVNGVCLTVLDCGAGWFTAAAMVMTMSRTAIGDWMPGRRVNLERAMRADSRFGGHIVQGHVDGVGTVKRTARLDDTLLLDVTLDAGLAETLVLHGSVALDGVSLTVNRLDGDKLQVALIDYTLQHAALGDLKEGSRVHVETDVIGKYVQRLVAPYLNRKPPPGGPGAT
ncbi:MAG: riboflavin synthase [Gemmatimonadaceae bacterium]|nr:riboflavin synthase [Gemmatimonadaceae bacterium]